jgi:hypothetical protein
MVQTVHKQTANVNGSRKGERTLGRRNTEIPIALLEISSPLLVDICSRNILIMSGI